VEVRVGVEVGGSDGVAVGVRVSVAVVVGVDVMVGVGNSGKVAEPRSVNRELFPASSRTTRAK
jgi:hypothetical protein